MNKDNDNRESEYIMLDHEDTTFLGADILRLTIRSTGKTVQFPQDVVKVGRDAECDLLLEDNPIIAPCQATFFHEKNCWFLCDNFSPTGTWINGAKMQPGKKYQLTVNDEINFATVEKVICFKCDGSVQSAGAMSTKSTLPGGTKSSTEILGQAVDKYIGRTISGKYKILKPIGHGGFCAMYLVEDSLLGKTWAMKVCDKTDEDYSPILRDIIHTELRMLHKLDHPALPIFVDIIEDEDSIFLVREYVEGENLENIVEREGPQPVDKVVEWGKQLCSVLEYFHKQDPPLIYRDMKPVNVILLSDGTVKLIDFGIMREKKPNQKADTCVLGTRGYAPPEQYGISQTDARSDIYGLGMTLFHLVTGISPKNSSNEIKPICQIDPDLPKGLEYIISKCTEPNPADRYQSCKDLRMDLDNFRNLPKTRWIRGKLFGR